MNRYGQLAQEHWRRWLPTRYATIPNPEDFFSTLGQETEDQVFDLTDQLAGPDPLGEGYLEKVGRLNNARMRAEEIVLADLVLLPPEPETLEDEEEETSTAAQALDLMRFMQELHSQSHGDQ